MQLSAIRYQIKLPFSPISGNDFNVAQHEFSLSFIRIKHHYKNLSPSSSHLFSIFTQLIINQKHFQLKNEHQRRR